MIRQETCSDKKTFITREEAEKKLEEIALDEEKREKRPTRFYKCPMCGYFHLTSMKKDTYKKMVVGGGFNELRIDRIANQWAEKNGWDVSEKMEKFTKNKRQ